MLVQLDRRGPRLARAPLLPGRRDHRTTLVGSTECGPWRTPSGDSVWAEDTLTVTPSGARIAGFVLAGDNNGGGSNATGAWDDVSATIEVVGLGSEGKGRRAMIVGMAM